MQPVPIPSGSPCWYTTGPKYQADVARLAVGANITRWADENPQFGAGVTDLTPVDGFPPQIGQAAGSLVPQVVFGLGGSTRMQYPNTAGPGMNTPFTVWMVVVLNNVSSKINKLIGLGSGDFGIVVDGTAGVIKCGSLAAPALTYTGRLPQGVPVVIQFDAGATSSSLWINNVLAPPAGSAPSSPGQGITLGGLGNARDTTNDLQGQILAATVTSGSMFSTATRLAMYQWAQAAVISGTNRRAWIVNPPATSQLALDDWVAGYACKTLDLGAPNIREVKNNAPDRQGVIDRTAFYADRVVSADMTAWPGGSSSMDDNLRKFAQCMNPAYRPVLHFTEESMRGELTLILRPVAYPVTFIHPHQLDFLLQWTAPDPVIRSIYTNVITNGLSPGPWPTGTAYGQPTGDVVNFPQVRLWGPIAAGAKSVVLQTQVPGGAAQTFTYALNASSPALTAGHNITFDSLARTIKDDAGTDYIAAGYINWPGSSGGWASIPPGYTASPYIGGSPTGTDPNNTHTDLIWQECYFS
jgi:hypothetical protein